MPKASSSKKRIQIPDSDSESSSSRNHNNNKRRKRIIQDSQQSQDLNDSDLDDLNSDNDKQNDAEEEEGEEGENGDLIDGIDNDGETSNPNGNGEHVERGRVSFRPEYERGDDGYVAGSVTRIKMINFMTYDHVEFRPGPHLNMILGPNGTGKSSIAAAIAIGLGFPPKVMGRANDLKSYVKQGAEVAEIEIELKGKRGKRNAIFWRKFHKEDEKSEWKFNNSHCNKQFVSERIQQFGIQANNLCSFLPQDKVAEFAKMAPEVVLRETMRAAGDPRLTKWHETLIESGVKSKEILNTLEGHINQRDRLQTQVDGLAPDVEHVQEREARETEAEILKHVVGVIEHNILSQRSQEARKEKDQAVARLKKLQDRRQPLKELKEFWDKKAHKGEVRVQTLETKYKDGMKDIRSKENYARNVGEKSSQVDDQLSKLRMIHERRQDEKRKLTDQIKKCQDILDEPKEEVDAQVKAKNREKADLQTEFRRKGRDIEGLRDEYEENKRMFADLNYELEELTRRQTLLENIEIQKETAARDFDPSIGFLLDWLKQHGHTLEAQVHKPPMISVSVPNQQYAWQVEQSTSLAQRSTFICTSQADFDHLLSLNGTIYPPQILHNGRRREGGKVRLNLAYQEVTEATVNPRRPCTEQQLKDCGIDGFAIDFVEAEPAVLAYLCQRANLHTAAVTQRPSAQIDGDALCRLGIRSWATKDDHTIAIQSSYGKRDNVQRTTPKQNARAFNLSVDRDAVKRIVEEIAKKKKTKFDREQPHSALKAKLDGIEREREDIRRAAADIDGQVKALQDQARRWQRAATDIEQFKTKLRKIDAQPSQEAERNKLKAEKLKHAKARLKPLDSWLNSCEEVFGTCTDLISSNLTGLQNTINRHAVSIRMTQGNEGLTKAQEEVKAANIRADEAKARSQAKWAHITSGIQDAASEIKEEVRARARDRTKLPPLDEVQGKLATLRAQLEMSVNIPGNVIARFNDYKDKLEKAQQIVDKEESELNKFKRDIKKTLDMFDPALETLVQAVSVKFSAAFARVKCSGEVRIRRVEGDFAAWGIEILVSYRDEDALAILTGSHQSGGERSLATVTYLMSLSEMSRTPFSLVDEINQGMDQRAERAVHNQLVEVTCDADAGQYFLITPKLLTGLTYHEKMKVLIINNGTHLPAPRKSGESYGNLSSCLKKYTKKHSIAAH